MMKYIAAIAFITTILSVTLLTLTEEQTAENKKIDVNEVKGVEVPHNISAEEAYQKLEREDVLLLDVRTNSEFETERISEAKNFNSYENLDPKSTYIVYCRTDNRSSIAVQEMKQLGFQEVYYMQGGIEAWKNAGLPTQ